MEEEQQGSKKLVLEDILTKNPLEILEIIKIKQEDAKIERHIIEPDLIKQETTPPVKNKPIKITKSILKGRFTPGTVFIKGDRHKIGDNHVFEVIGVENSSGRVRFTVYTLPLIENSKPITTLSLSIAALTGQKETFAYKKGDLIIFNDKDYVVKGINPASKNVVLEVDGKLRYVKISKIRLHGLRNSVTVPETTWEIGVGKVKEVK